MPLTPEDMLRIEAEQRMWEPTMHLRRYRPARCDDDEIVLQQLWERITGEREWREVPLCMED